MEYTACTEWCHLWWIPLSFFVWSKKKGMQTWHLFFKLALRGSIMSKQELCRKPLEARGLCIITAMELQENQEENSPREITWLWVWMPTSQLRKESYYLNRSRVTAVTVGWGKEQRKEEQLCFALPWLLLRVWECQHKCVCSVHTLLTGRDWGWEPEPSPLRSPEHGTGNAQAVVTDSADGTSQKWQRQVFDWTAGTHGLPVLLPTADMCLLHSHGATSTDMLLHIPMEMPQQCCSAQGGDFSRSQEMPDRARVSQRAASWNTLRTHTNTEMALAVLSDKCHF